jgi:hypothetical protein
MCLYLIGGGAGLTGLWHTLVMTSDDHNNQADTEESKANDTPAKDKDRPKEIGGRGGLDPTRYGDWEKAGRCVDF